MTVTQQTLPSPTITGVTVGPLPHMLTFPPDGSKVAYVREADIFVEDLTNGDIEKLTRRDNESIINGIMSWAYEEEFGIRDGFRWSPDGEYIAFWQFDTSGVRDFLIIDNTSGYRNYNAPKPSEMPALKAAIAPLLTP